MNESEKEFERNVNQLIQLLKKILKSGPLAQSPFSKFLGQDKDSPVQVNLFFTFLPFPLEEMEELEEIYEHYFFHDEKQEDFSNELSSEDQEFLRRHGIQF